MSVCMHTYIHTYIMNVHVRLSHIIDYLLTYLLIYYTHKAFSRWNWVSQLIVHLHLCLSWSLSRDRPRLYIVFNTDPPNFARTTLLSCSIVNTAFDSVGVILTFSRSKHSDWFKSQQFSDLSISLSFYHVTPCISAVSAVTLSVRLSVIFVHSVQTAKDIVKLLYHPSSRIILDFWPLAPIPNS